MESMQRAYGAARRFLIVKGAKKAIEKIGAMLRDDGWWRVLCDEAGADADMDLRDELLAWLGGMDPDRLVAVECSTCGEEGVVEGTDPPLCISCCEEQRIARRKVSRPLRHAARNGKRRKPE